VTWAPTGQGLSVFSERYAQTPEETWSEACHRVSYAVAGAEASGEKGYWRERFYEELVENTFMPGGRIWYGAGRIKGQMLNCFVIPTEDSITGWAKTVGNLMEITALGGGVGMNFSAIRPRGSAISRGGQATGAVSLMQACNGVGDVLRGGGGRRIAMMNCLDLDHPDIDEFIHKKLDLGELNNANVSVVIPRDYPSDRFVQDVLQDRDISLRFSGHKDKGKASLSELWQRIVSNAWNSGEPGVLNGYLANQQNNLFYKYPLISTNPCGEIWLPAYGCCDLGALVLPRFVSAGRLDWDKLEQVVRLGVRFLDDVLSVNVYPLKAIEEVCQGERRIGLGVQGLHSMLMDLGVTYDQPESFRFVGRLFNFIRNCAYEESISLAQEKGVFRYYSPQLLQSGYARTLPKRIREGISEHGLRNCALLTIAPTGTTSMVSGVTSGIEPLFSSVYVRRRWKGDSRAECLVFSKDYIDHSDTAQGAYDIHPRNHFEMQRIVQRYIDNAVSKTINLPADYPVEELSDLWLEYLPYLKGTTFYRQGSRGFEPLEHVPAERVNEVLANWTGEIEYDGVDGQDCATGVCEV
jgi:ribonucleoside-diphosphate reductase alpha chain